jgi:hypothetical protein
MAKQYISHGGISTAREILEKALGRQGDGNHRTPPGMLQGTPFDFSRRSIPTICSILSRANIPRPWR